MPRIPVITHMQAPGDPLFAGALCGMTPDVSATGSVRYCTTPEVVSCAVCLDLMEVVQ